MEKELRVALWILTSLAVLWTLIALVGVFSMVGMMGGGSMMGGGMMDGSGMVGRHGGMMGGMGGMMMGILVHRVLTWIVMLGLDAVFIYLLVTRGRAPWTGKPRT